MRKVRFDAYHDYSPRTAPFSRRPSEDDWVAIEAVDAEHAAEEFAERSDSDGDYTIIRNNGGQVWVRDAEGVITGWEIFAEAEPHYYATEKKLS